MSRNAFTLAELLIALAILGVIATFTIPKVLTAQAEKKRIAIVKETVGSISAAFQNYLSDNGGSTSNFQSSNIAPYLNYVRVDTMTTVNFTAAQQRTCSTGWPQCLKLHNGAMLYYWPNWFCGTGISGVHYEIDMDAQYIATDNDVISIVLYNNGKITSAGAAGSSGTTIPYATAQGTACSQFLGTDPDPPWFSWN